MNIASIIGGQRRELCEMPWPEYKDFPALNCSTIVRGRKSMLHLLHAWQHDGEDTEAMQFGRLQHCLLFEPQEVENRYWTWTGRRAGNDYKAYCEEAEASDAEVVRDTGQYSMESALEAAQGFLRNSRIQALIAAGKAEQTILIPEVGMQCKGRLDWISTAEHVLTDLKTTAEIEPNLFGRSFFRFGYDLKLGFYRRWLNNISGDQWPVEVIVLESKPPYDVATIPIPDAVLDRGVDKGLEILARIKECIEADEWPGIANGRPMMLMVPYYEMEEETEEWTG